MPLQAKPSLSLTAVFLLLFSLGAQAQIGINTDGTAPRAGTLLDIKANQTPAGTDSTVVITDRGFVGIGTTDPTNKLLVVEDSLNTGGALRVISNIDNTASLDNSVAGVLRIENSNTDANNYTGLVFKSSDSGGMGRHAAAIGLLKDGAWSGAGYPGHLTFWTRPSSGDEVERMRITSSGNVGIGTTAPVSTLNAVGNFNPSTSTNTTILAQGIFGGGIGLLNVNNKTSGFWTTDQGGIETMHLQVGATGNFGGSQGDFVFNQAGKLGIGTFLPTGKFHIHNDAVGADSAFVVTDRGFVGIGTTAPSTKFHIHNDASGSDSAFVVTDRGFVGIGTTSPDTKLHTQVTTDSPNIIQIKNTSFGTNAHSILRLWQSEDGTKDFGGDAVIQFGIKNNGAGDADASWYAGIDKNTGVGNFDPDFKIGYKLTGFSLPGDGDKLTIKANGNVGIGTTAPIAALDVATDAYIGANYFWPGSGAIELGTRLSGNRYSYIDFHGDDTYSDYGLRIIRDNTGPNADSYLQHRGTGILSLWTQEAAPIKFITSSTDRMIITAGGNVGIGPSAAPPEKLTVAGNIAPATDNTYDLGTVSLRWDDVYATNGTIQTSDKRLKENIRPLQYGLATVLAMEPVHFSWKEGDQRKKVGFLAQNMKPLVPEVVHVGDDAQQTLGLNYAELVPVLVKAIQELKTQNDALLERVKAIEEEGK